VDTGLALLSSSSLPLKYWGEAFNSAVHIINLLPTPMLNNISPYEKLFLLKPDYNFLKVFGCACYPLLRPYNQYKFDFHSSLFLFLGYDHKGYICLAPSGKRIISRHVIFNEYSFPFSMPHNPFLIHDINVDTTSTFSSPLTIVSLSHDTSSDSTASLPPSHSPPSSPSVLADVNTHPMITRAKSGIRKAKVFQTFVSNESFEPASYKQALQDPNWFQAMHAEYVALLQNNTWTLTTLPSGANLVGCKWVFKRKYNADGSFQRYKARLVAKGFHQREGEDFSDTFSPVIKPTTICIVLTIALSSKWPIHHIDINSAFLHGDLDSPVYMQQPPGLSSTNPSLVCRLNKAIYELKQAPCSWFQKLTNTLLCMGFVPSKSDTSHFTRFSNNDTLYILIYVDDTLVTGSSQCLVQDFISNLHSHFALKDLGSLHYFLGLEVTWLDTSLHLSQSKYIRDLLRRTNMLHSKPQPTPMVSSLRLTADQSVSVDDPSLYRSIVGALQYVTITRPELSFSVRKVCQYMHKPQLSHWQAVKQILRYLAGTSTDGLHFSSSSTYSITGFSDSDWATDLDDRKSTTGYCIFVGNNLVSWSSKKQKVVSRSSTEAEYRSVAAALADIIWIQSLMHELRVTSPTPQLYSDNLGAVQLAANPVMHSQSKHFELDLHL